MKESKEEKFVNMKIGVSSFVTEKGSRRYQWEEQGGEN